VGTTPTPLAGNGVQHPEIVLIFWEDEVSGPVWSQGHDKKGNPPSITYGQIVGSALSLVNTPFFASLSQYGTNVGINGPITITAPRLSPMAPIWTTAAPHGGNTGSFNKEQDVTSIINKEISNGAVPGVPQPLDDMLYVFIPPPGTGASDCVAAGPGTFVSCNDTGGSANFNGQPYVRILIGNPSGSPTTGNVGQSLSHEITEAIAGWSGTSVTGCTDNGKPVVVGVCDWCGCLQETQNGVKVQAYWSQVDKACVIPEAWGNLEVNHSFYNFEYGSVAPQNGWAAPPGDFPMRQIYGGAGGVIATGTDDNLYYYNDSAGTWYSTGGGQGSEFAAAGDHVLRLPLDTSLGPSWYSVSTNTWHPLPPLSNGPTTSAVVVNSKGGVLVVTDRYGQPWSWDWNIPKWVRIGGPGDQFVASGGSLLGLTPDHRGVFEYPGSEFGTTGQNWSGQPLSVGPIASIVAGPENGLGRYWGVVPHGDTSLYYQGTDRLVRSVNPPYPSMEWVASAAAGGFLSMDTGQQFVHDWEYVPPNPPFDSYWNTLDAYGPAGRLVAGSAMYLTDCAGTACDVGILASCAAPCVVIKTPKAPPPPPPPPPTCSFAPTRTTDQGVAIDALLIGLALVARRRSRR